MGELEVAPRADERSIPAADRNSLRAAFEDSRTLDVRLSGAPAGTDGRPDDAPTYWSTYTSGVTDEAPGRYRAEPNGELGRGAIGRVFLAHDSHLDRPVAIKVLLEGLSDPSDRSQGLQTLARFLREARVTGGLEHPGIVPVYELGRRADGALYYAMRVVRGRTLARAIADAEGLGERLALVNHFSGLCQAIAYAHSRGVVHRDIKPENVMIGEFGETVVLDWGMAKVCASDAEEWANEGALPKFELADLGLTVEGSLCGTPLYMSPEQVSGRTREVDQRSDVWSLGVVLYTLLCGQPPFSGKTLLEIVAQVNAGRFTPLRALSPRIPAELSAIVERSLQPSQHDRYPSARELTCDVQAYQAGMRVTAYEYSSLELLRRFVARHRSAVTASALALVVILVLSVAAYRRVVAARDRAIWAEQRAHENELSARHSAEAARHSLGEVLFQRAQQALLEGDSVTAELLAARALVQEERADARGVVIAAQSAVRPALSFTLPLTRGCAHSALSFSAGTFACATGRELALWSTNQKTLSFSSTLSGEVSALAFASDGSALAVAFSDGTLGVRTQNVANEAWQYQHCGQKPTALAVALGGQSLACANARGDVKLWQRGRAGGPEQLKLGQAVSALAFSKDGSHLAMGGELGGLVVYDAVARKAHRLAGHAGTVLALVLAEQGRYLASAGADRTVRFWDTVNGREPQAPIVHGDTISALAWSDDRHFIALAGRDKTFRVVDLRTGHGALVRQQGEPADFVALSPDAQRLASYSRDIGLRLWSLAAAERPSELSERGNVLALALGVGPDQLLSAGIGRNGVCVWELATGACIARLPVRLDRVRALAVSPDRQKLALAGSGRQILVWDLVQKIPTQVIEGLADETRALAFSLDGRTLAAAGLGRRLRIFDVASAALLHEVETSAPIQTLSVAPKSGLLITGDQAGVLTFRDPKTGQAEEAWQAHSDWVLGSAVSPDGSELASAGADRSIKIWSLPARKHLFTLTGHDGKVESVDFSPDGALLASGGEDKSVRLWDARVGRALATLPGHSGLVRAVRFTNRAALLASGGDDGVIRLWHLEALTGAGLDLEANVRRQFGLESTEAALAAP